MSKQRNSASTTGTAGNPGRDRAVDRLEVGRQNIPTSSESEGTHDQLAGDVVSASDLALWALQRFTRTYNRRLKILGKRREGTGRLGRDRSQALGLLQADDRRVLAELAKQTGSSPSTINNRIKRLVRNGVITGFHARVAAETVGPWLLAFVLVSLSSKVEQHFLKEVETSRNVLECHRMAGEWNYLIKLRINNMHDLEAYLAAMSNLIGIQRTNTLIALSTIKETGLLRLARFKFFAPDSVQLRASL